MQYLPMVKGEVLRYLGYRRKQELTSELSEIVDGLMQEVQETSKARYTYQVFDLIAEPENEVINIVGTDFIIPGKNAYNHLKNAEKIVLYAGTLGLEIERKTRIYETIDLTKGFILDACAVEYIEKVLDLAEVDVSLHYPDYYLNRRFSPGYGDVPLSIQADFIQVSGADKKLGLTLTDHYLMIPRKSVTAFAGLFKNAQLARPKWKCPADMTEEMVKAARMKR
ncbi:MULTISPECIES: vitamin B12 dependent-methionine synthase activation domain-containing protein [unclassified Enterococcus]|uniref:vitamin B12 dependent-methionine synthase activation domain-containing protein n=1 Tax=unclassified Enterococcus TaxID=2608891 RepID=UPI001555A1C1|nr:MULTISPECIES: vitamin B12 dependent-methionine synthase activation domain-containing protein [unclassified Enterococcus]MBS7578006.1 methionine synthase [Enterococcus sp. MMGLQ5-2]MBS7585304.1 methionine synthase [Enterococcus sp. MMGLQ5-1]NPD13161.1 methionine synthase [Enterococcus sp. MMGLQ5-1]NPD37837.1 methionine synthase [Enterococcus sp. MMGLQ5-2]